MPVLRAILRLAVRNMGPGRLRLALMRMGHGLNVF
jgi:hypothetical protein